jgi:hypothetical protein
MAIRKMQCGGEKIDYSYLVPYRMREVKGKDRYEVENVGDSRCLKVTTTSVDNMKSFEYFTDESDDNVCEEEELENLHVL